MSKTNNKNQIRIFEEREVRAIWDEQDEKWWFSVVDIIAILINQPDYRKAVSYWNTTQKRLVIEGGQLSTFCRQLKMQARDGKMRLTDVADTEQILRIVQSIPSKKAEPFKMWLAKVGAEIVEESIDPELSIERAVEGYRRLGYSETWINQRIKSIEVRKALTDEWNKSGVSRGKEYALLTDLMSQTWAGLSVKQYKAHKGLKKENLRDHMTNTELILNMLAESATTDISIVRQPSGFVESMDVAIEGAEAAKAARLKIEQSTGKTVISSLNAKNLSGGKPVENSLSDLSFDKREDEEEKGNK